MKIAAASLALFTLAACGPRTGPDDGEAGRILFWRVSGDAEVDVSEGCSDSPDLADTFKPLEFEPNSYLTYRVNEGADDAIAMDCDRLSADACTEFEPEILFVSEGSAWVGGPAPERSVIDGQECILSAEQAWRVDDDGETGTFTMAITLNLEGSTCPEFDAAIANSSPNGKGMDGCVFTQEVPLEFDAAR